MSRQIQMVAAACAAMVLAAGVVAGVVAPGATAASTDSAAVSADGGEASLVQNASGSDNGTATPDDGVGTDASDGENDSDAAADGDAASAGTTAYQFDVAVGEVITDLGTDEEAFYARQGRLLQAQTVRADGSVTGSFRTMASPRTVEGCQIAYDPVSYDSGEVTVDVSVEGCESATLTLAVYELPGDTIEFRRDRADEQELVTHRTTTVDGGESVTLSVDVDEDDASDGEVAPSESESAADSTPDDAAAEPTETETETGAETPERTPTETETETPEEEATPEGTEAETETETETDGSADLRISDVNKEVDGNERANLERETVTITNDGDAAVDLSGYTLVYGTGDERQQTYTFDEGFTLNAGESVTVHTGEGTDTETDVYLGSGNPVLNNEESERLVLRDDDGNTVAETTT